MNNGEVNGSEIRARLIRIEEQLKALIHLEERIEKAETAIDGIKIRLAYGIGFAGGLAVVWTVVTTLYHLIGEGR